MKSFTYKGTEIEVAAIRFVYGSEETVQDGILVHDSSDEFHDGDAIYGNGWTIDMVSDEDDVETLLSSGDGTTYFHRGDNGIYHIEA